MEDHRQDIAVAIATGLVPIITVVICTLWSIRIEAVPRCMPFMDGCMSISAACRTPPILYFFRTVMLPFSLLLAAFWLVNDRQLRSWLPQHVRQRKAILLCGLTGAALLVLYVTFLGTDGEAYEFMRRFGVYVFFAGTGVAELWTTLLLRARMPGRIVGIQFALVLLLLALGPANLILKAVIADPDAMENRIEWVFGLLLFLYPLLSAARWRTATTPDHARPGR